MLNRPRNWFLVFWLASALALAGALTSQFVFDLRPCHLCLYQRWPYSIALALLTPLLFYQNILPARLVVIMGVLAALFFAGAAIAGYHTGVEQHWWAGPSDCSGGITPDTLEALKAEIMGATIVRCDEPAFVFLGLSMAAWNMLYSFGLLVIALIGMQKWRGRN